MNIQRITTVQHRLTAIFAGLGLLAASLIGFMPAKASAVLISATKCTYNDPCQVQNVENSYYCWEIANSSLANGVKLKLAPCNYGSLNQQFIFSRTSTADNTEYFRIYPKHAYSNKCLDVEGARTHEGNAIGQWTCFAGYHAHQQWRVGPSGGEFQIAARHTLGTAIPKCASTGFGVFTNALIEIYSCADADRWYLI